MLYQIATDIMMIMLRIAEIAAAFALPFGLCHALIWLRNWNYYRQNPEALARMRRQTSLTP